MYKTIEAHTLISLNVSLRGSRVLKTQGQNLCKYRFIGFTGYGFSIGIGIVFFFFNYHCYYISTRINVPVFALSDKFKHRRRRRKKNANQKRRMFQHEKFMHAIFFFKTEMDVSVCIWVVMFCSLFVNYYLWFFSHFFRN